MLLLEESRRRAIERRRPDGPLAQRLRAPEYDYDPEWENHSTPKIQLAMRSFAQHMTSETHQLQLGLERAGYLPVGLGYGQHEYLDARDVCARYTPQVLVLADKREWDPTRPGCFDPDAEFRHTTALADRPDIFRLTVFKDAHQNPAYHRRAHEEIGCHAWITYYHPELVTAMAPWVRPEHLVRTYHSIDPAEIPEYLCSAPRRAAVVSGICHPTYYPLRTRIAAAAESGRWPGLEVIRHPSYGADGCHTPEYLGRLSQYRVSICTTSCFGYALRKIIESTAVGCTVVTDLPLGETLPAIEPNLIRVSHDATVDEVRAVVEAAAEAWEPERQRRLAQAARECYDYRNLYVNVARRIDQLRTNWSAAAHADLGQS